MSDYTSLMMGAAFGAAAFIWMLVRIRRHKAAKETEQ